MNQGNNRPGSQGGAFPQGSQPSQQQQAPQPGQQNAQASGGQSRGSGSRSGAAGNNDNEPLIIEEKVQIVNGEHIVKKYQRGNLLGKGGFAKCFQVTNLETKKIMAAKIIPKNTLVKNRARQKLISEIKIHKSLHNTNVVKFEHVFEDHDNVYILLELCPHQTLNELIKRRKRLTELETLCYIVQIVQALKYLHSNRVIHRDLKLGNLFIGDKMEIKLGDFGLATKLEFEGEKKRTICGTPNYIAPEILDGRIGHSYEVDIWSLGVIIYTLLIGKPPFETQDVKATYKKIKANDFSFPDHAPIPEQAKALISLILVQDPAKRPTLDEILAHPFINNGGTIPPFLPITTLHNAPSQSYLKPYAPSAINQIAQQNQQNQRENQKQQGLGKSQTQANIMKGVDFTPNFYPTDDKKGSFVNQPSQPGQNNNQFISQANLQTSKNVPTANPYQTSTGFQPPNNKSDNSRPQTSNSGNQPPSQQQVPNQDDRRQNGMSGTGIGRYQSAQQLPNINGAGVSRQDSQPLQQPQQPATGSQQDNIVQVDGSRNSLWVTHYVDYSTKYGLGYLLSNGSSGVLFNDTTKIILDTKGIYFEYIHRVSNEDITEKHEMTNYPQTLQKKVTLLQHFRNYLLTEQARRVVGSNDTPSGSGTAATNKKQESNYQQVPGQPLAYLKKWMQTKHAIMFRLSNKIVQVQFSDKTEILLNSQDKIVSFMNKKGERSHYPLADAMSSSNSDMTKRLRYTKEILTHLLKNNANTNSNQRQNTGVEGANPSNPINVNPNDDPTGQQDPTGNNVDNLKFGMTGTMENDFPRLNSNNNNNLGGADPFLDRQLKGGVSQKNLNDKDQMNILPQNKQTISQKALNTNFLNQGTNNPSNQIFNQQQQQQQQQQNFVKK